MPLGSSLNRWTRSRGRDGPAPLQKQEPRWVDNVLLLAGAVATVLACHHSLEQVGLGETLQAFGQGLLTFGRVLAVVGGSTLIFLPLAVLIGLRPRWAALLQPVMLMLASIPANLLFPFLPWCSCFAGCRSFTAVLC